jgi:hypothetical protein
VTYNKIFWIDSDIEWSPEDFFKLYDSELEVVSGAYLLADGVTTTIQLDGGRGGLSKEDAISMTDTIKVQSVGFGFVAMSSGVFEKIQRPWFSHLAQGFTNERGEQMYDSLGEDISWCLRALEAGFDIYFDSTVLVNHIKTVPITWE